MPATLRVLTMLPLLLALLLTMSCAAAQVDEIHPAVQVVEEMYAANSAGDMHAYMDAMMPENRRRPNPFGLFAALELHLGPVGFTAEPGDLTFSELQFRVLRCNEDYALVQAEGFARYTPLLWEIPFCDQHDARPVDGRWYVDVYAPERLVRLQQLFDRRVQEMAAGDPAAGNIEELLDGILNGESPATLLDELGETLLDLCPVVEAGG